jgi:sulfite exporter TauE/SafE
MLDGTPLQGAGALAALAAGVSGSLHCALMCGPLACAALPRSRARGASTEATTPAPARTWVIAAWHAGRIAAYALVGAALGAAGQGLAALLASRVQPILPWVMAAGFVAAAFDFGGRLPGWIALGGAGQRIARLGARSSAAPRAFALGAATPLLPCGLLWGMFLAAVGAGTFAGGALVMGAFALGGTPGLAAVQLGTSWTGRWPRLERAVRVGVPLVAAAVLVVRALGAGDPAAGGAAPHHHH